MDNQTAVPGDVGRSSAERANLRYRLRFSIRSLLLIPALLASASFCVRHGYERDRKAVASLAPRTLFHHQENYLAWFSCRHDVPDVIGRFRWTGPSFLESPMRENSIPWFDRVVRVEILDDERLSLGALTNVIKLPHLKEIEVYYATRPASYYGDAIHLHSDDITLTYEYENYNLEE